MTAQSEPLTTYTVGKITLDSYLRDLWRYRHLCLHLAGSDLLSRFRRSTLGLLWLMIHPLAFTMLYSLVLATIFNQEFRDYSVYVFSGLIMWDALSSYMNQGSNSLVNATGYIKQAPMPLILFPIRVAMTVTLVTAIGFVSFSLFSGGLVLFFGLKPFFSIYWLWMAPILVALFLIGVPWATVFGFLNVKFRDTQQALVVFTQAIWLTSPIFFARDIFNSPHLGLWTAINPIVAYLDVFRDTVIKGQPPELRDWAVIGVWIVVSWIGAIAMLNLNGRRSVFYL